MVVNLQYLKKKYLKNFPNNEKLCNFVMTDILFGFSEISEILKKNQKINSVLEIGSGSGILLNELKTFFPHINFIGIDPVVPYEPPENPDIILNTKRETAEESVQRLCSYLEIN